MARLATAYLLPDVLFHHVQRPGSLTTGQHPAVGTLRESRRIGERVAELARTHPEGPVDAAIVEDALREFRYREWHLAVAGTAMRAPLDAQTRQEWLRLALAGARLRDAAHLVRRDPELAARVAALTGFGRHYPAVYQSVVTLRAGVNRVTGRGVAVRVLLLSNIYPTRSTPTGATFIRSRLRALAGHGIDVVPVAIAPS